MSEIWYRESKKAWYVQVDRRRQMRLGKTKKQAETAYREWLISQGGTLPESERKKLTVAEIGQQFLEAAQRKKATTHAFYRYFIDPFLNRFGSVIAKDLSPLAFEKWLDERPGWKACRRNAIVVIRRLYNWAVKGRLLKENPILWLRCCRFDGQVNAYDSPFERRSNCVGVR